MHIITHHKSLPSSGIVTQRSSLPEEEIPWLQGVEESEIWNTLVEERKKNGGLFEKEWLKICHELGREDLLNYGLSLDYRPIEKSWLRLNRQASRIPYDRRYYASLLRGLLISSDHIASTRNMDISQIPRIPALQQYRPSLGSKIRNFQKAMGEVIGNAILRAPTGSGKTLAALLWAARNQQRNGRLFYVLPNIASINAMFLRLLNEFGEENVGVLHSRVASYIYSMRETSDDIISRRLEQARARSKNRLAREIWYPIRVCTPHQIFRFTLQGRGWEAMLSEFPHSCFIFDEVHAYDPVITGLTLATAKYLSFQSASCLFLSATMPLFLSKLIEKEVGPIKFVELDPTHPTDKEIMHQTRHTIQLLDGNILSNLDFIVKEIQKANSTLIVCNHVQSAQIVNSEVCKKLGKKDVVLLHSRFNRHDCNEIEKHLQSSLPRILVSTQVVEVSLDIDFEQGFIEPAPLDALIQRLGRINRYGKRPPASVRIFKEQLERHNLYDRKLVERSLSELGSLPTVIGERELIQVSDKVYADGYDEENESLFQDALNHRLIKDFQDNLLAGSYRDWVEDVIEKSDSTIEVLPISLLDKYRKYERIGLKIEADDLLVPIRLRSLSRVRKYIDLSDEPFKANVLYSTKTGLELKEGEDYSI
jgi:CRISPR-associated endonuclease/helicase Cas3